MDNGDNEEPLSLDVMLENPYRATPWSEGPHVPKEGSSMQASKDMRSFQMDP